MTYFIGITITVVIFPFPTPRGTVYHQEYIILSTTPMSVLSGKRLSWEVNLTSMAVNQDKELRKNPLKEPNISVVIQNEKLDRNKKK